MLSRRNAKRYTALTPDYVTTKPLNSTRKHFLRRCVIVKKMCTKLSSKIHIISSEYFDIVVSKILMNIKIKQNCVAKEQTVRGAIYILQFNICFTINIFVERIFCQFSQTQFKHNRKFNIGSFILSNCFKILCLIKQSLERVF